MTLVIDGVLFCFKWQNSDKQLLVTKNEKLSDGGEMIITKLAPAPQYRKQFALSVIKNRFVVLSGGANSKNANCAEIFILDTETGRWLTLSK